MEVAVEAGAEDVQNEGESFRITTAPSDLESVRQAIEKAGLKVVSSEVEKIADTTVKVEGDHAAKLMRLIDGLEDHDDVSHVWSNEEIDEPAAD
jgi:transcriptional/translational regulatory protein YebC/TACO1